VTATSVEVPTEAATSIPTDETSISPNTDMMSAIEVESDALGPYGRAWEELFNAGWPVFPLPPRRKNPPPTGWTGAKAPYPGYADCYAWAEEQPESNVGGHIPKTLLLVDIDDYDGKNGGRTLDELEALLGPLPPTWKSTNQLDTRSGHLCYATDEGLAWPGMLGNGIDVLQARHRYAVLPPSVHPSGRVYTWVSPTGDVSDTPPDVSTLPRVPEKWKDYFTHGELARDKPSAGVAKRFVGDWMRSTTNPYHPCRRMAVMADRAIVSIEAGNGSRHDVATNAIWHLTHLAADGHAGLVTCCQRITDAFMPAITNRATDDEAAAEMDRMISGAVDAASTHTGSGTDPCDSEHELDGLVPPESIAAMVATLPALQARAAELARRREGATKVPSPEVATSSASSASSRLPGVGCMADVVPERLAWLWPGRLPKGKLIVMEGDPSLGKSSLWVDFSGHLTTGTPWPDGTPCPIGAVAVMSAEDGLADTVRPRLDAAGADPALVHVLTEVEQVTPAGYVVTRPPTLGDIAEITSLIETTHAVLLVVDVLMAYLPGKADAHRDQDVRAVLHRLNTVAEATGCTMLLLRHLNKSTGGPAMYRGGGSIGIIGAARGGLLVAQDPDDETGDIRVLASNKNNLAKKSTSLRYRLTSVPGADVARIEWLGTSSHIAETLLASPERGEDRPEASAVDQFITSYLSHPNRGGTAPSKDVEAAARAAGFSTSAIRRSRERLCDKPDKSKFNGGWLWTLRGTSPKPAIEAAEAAEDATTLGVDEGAHLRAAQRCDLCRQPLLLTSAGRTRCERCSLDLRTAEAAA